MECEHSGSVINVLHYKCYIFLFLGKTCTAEKRPKRERTPTNDELNPQSTDGETEETEKTPGVVKTLQVNYLVFIILINCAFCHFENFCCVCSAQSEKLDGLLKEEELHGMPKTTEFENRWEVNLEGEFFLPKYKFVYFIHQVTTVFVLCECVQIVLVIIKMFI